MAESRGQHGRVRSIHDPRYLELLASIRLQRKQRGLTQAALAAKLGRGQSYIAKVETGERRLDVIETLDLCAALGVPLSDVVAKDFLDLLVGSSEASAA